jgi:hypothetical protein
MAGPNGGAAITSPSRLRKRIIESFLGGGLETHLFGGAGFFFCAPPCSPIDCDVEYRRYTRLTLLGIHGSNFVKHQAVFFVKGKKRALLCTSMLYVRYCTIVYAVRNVSRFHIFIAPLLVLQFFTGLGVSL